MEHDPHDHGHSHGHDHGHGHTHDHALNVIEEPLDPASQSLSDALRASFRVLKVIMLVVVILFLVSGVYRVGQGERVIVSHLGTYAEPAGPGLHMAWPYPIDERITVPVSPQSIPIEAFWLKLSDVESKQQLTDLGSRGDSLDPAKDGALLTGDHAIMHLKLTAAYTIADPLAYVKNVSDKDRMLRSVLQNAAIAISAGTESRKLLGDPSGVAQRIRVRAQASLDALHTGIKLDTVSGDKSFYPLQTKDAFLQVSQAEQTKEEAKQGAVSERDKKLNGAAGSAWKEIYDQIQLLDQNKSGPERDKVLKEIDRLITDKATGEAGGRIQLARAHKEQIKADAQARVATFKAYLPAYKANPELVKLRRRQQILTTLLENDDLVKIFLTPGDKQVFMILGKDPVQIKENDAAAMKREVEGQR